MQFGKHILKATLFFIFAVFLTNKSTYADTMYTTEELNVRESPGYEGEIVDVLDKGASVDVLFTVERERKWAIIEYGDYLKAVCADYLSEDRPMYFYGTCTITHYCPCAQCCGKSDGITASGVPATVNHTVANGSLPFGTRLLINGQEYVVEDRGVGAYTIDIFVGGHQEAWNLGMYQADVYILD